MLYFAQARCVFGNDEFLASSLFFMVTLIPSRASRKWYESPLRSLDEGCGTTASACNTRNGGLMIGLERTTLHRQLYDSEVKPQEHSNRPLSTYESFYKSKALPPALLPSHTAS